MSVNYPVKTVSARYNFVANDYLPKRKIYDKMEPFSRLKTNEFKNRTVLLAEPK